MYHTLVWIIFFTISLFSDTYQEQNKEPNTWLRHKREEDFEGEDFEDFGDFPYIEEDYEDEIPTEDYFYGNITGDYGDYLNYTYSFLNSQGPPRPVHKNTGNERNRTAEERLLQDLFRFYNPGARAGLDSKDTVTVEIQYTLLRIQGLDERTQVLTTTGLVITEWVDERLTWRPQDYADLHDIVVPPSMVWLPELTLMNGAQEMAQDFDRMGVSITHNGRLHWEPGGIFSTTCDIDITYFPFDKQNCPVIVGSWAYYSQRMNLTNSTSEVYMHDFTPNGEWEILDTEVNWNETTIPCCPDIKYPQVTATLYLKRRIHYYFVNVMIPCFMLSVLVLIAFCIPPEAGEKVSCSISVLLAFTVFLLMVSETVPKTSLQMPIIAIYLTTTMLLGATSLALSIMVLNIYHSNKGKPVPRYIQIIIITLLGSILFIRSGSLRKKSMKGRAKVKNVECQCEVEGVSQDVIYLEQSQTEVPCSSTSLHGNQTYQSPQNKTYQAHPIDTYQSNDQETYQCPTPETYQELLNRHNQVIGQGHNQVIGQGQSLRNRQDHRKHIRGGHLQKQPPPKYEHIPDWRDVSRVLDRLFFFLVLMAMLISSALTLCAPYYESS